MRHRVPGYGGGYPWWAYEERPDLLRETNTIQACWERLDLADVVRVTEAVGARKVA